MTYRTKKTLKTHVSAFIRFTFQPLFSVTILVGALCVNAIMAILLFRYQPISAAVLFFGSNGFFGVAMMASLWSYMQYRRFYKSVFKK